MHYKLKLSKLSMAIISAVTGSPKVLKRFYDRTKPTKLDLKKRVS